jgi:putative Holliday junction resolvase
VTVRVLGIDPGLKRVGLALGDERDGLASPHKTLERKDDASLLRALLRELVELEIGKVVLGLPLRMNGLEGPEARRARSLGDALAKQGVAVVMWDERLTTVAAERQLRASGVRAGKKKSLIDQAAATVLLQSYLDARRSAS